MPRTSPGERFARAIRRLGRRRAALWQQTDRCKSALQRFVAVKVAA
ncbi:MAG: hypothetical protein V9F03_05540 [Microthrixaceae bacterium]